MGRGILFERGQAMRTARPLQPALRGRDLRQKSFKCELLSRTERGLFAECSGGSCGWSQGQGDRGWALRYGRHLLYLETWCSPCAKAGRTALQWVCSSSRGCGGRDHTAVETLTVSLHPGCAQGCGGVGAELGCISISHRDPSPNPSIHSWVGLWQEN